jgi:hypothetical protein
MLFSLMYSSPSTKKNNVIYTFQALYENRVLVLLYNKTKSLAFKMKTFQLYPDTKVLCITWNDLCVLIDSTFFVRKLCSSVVLFSYFWGYKRVKFILSS